jgi:hypothetical protein
MINPLTELETALAHFRLSSEPCDERFEELRQQYETVLNLLESHFLGALLSGNWDEFEDFVNDFRVTQDVDETNQTEDSLTELWLIAFPKGSTEVLSGPGADHSHQNNDKEIPQL